MDILPISRIYHQIEAELQAYLNQLNKLEALTYPTATAQEIIDHLRGKIADYRHTCELILSEKDDDNLDETRRKLITQVHNPLVQQDVRFLRWLRDAQTHDVPWSFISSVERLGRAIIPEHKLLVFCSDHYNYGITWSQSERLAPFPYTVLSLPRLHRTDILWHTLIGHELFHPRCEEFLNRHNQKVLEQISQKLTDSDALFKEIEKERLDQMSKLVHSAWRRAMEELLCDMACVELFGPASILAMRAFSACSPDKEMPSPDTKFYPPWRYRLEVIWNRCIDETKLGLVYEKCADSEVMPHFRAEMENVKQLSLLQEGAALVDKHPLAKIAYKYVKDLLDEAATFVSKALPSSISRWCEPQVLDQLPELISRVNRGIPPSEIVTHGSEVEGSQMYESSTPELAAILIAGWMYETYWQMKNVNAESDFSYSTLSRLVLKACEDIELSHPGA